jgi:hypothetical protein
MTTSLHDRLAELADDAPPGGPVPELWDRATRLHRTRRAGTVVILAVAAALLVAVGLLVHVRSTSDVLPASGTAGVPDRLYAPGRWLPGTTEAGPLGQLAAVLPAVRGVVDPDDPARTESFRLDREFRSAPVPNSTGRRLAGIPGNQTPHPVGLVEVSDGRATTTIVPGSKRTFEALTWLDDDRVVVQRARDRSREVQLVSVLDVEDGSLADLVTIPYDAQNASFASDLLALPVGPAVRPPRPVDPRMKAVAIAAIIAAAGAAAALWRRRVRA